MKTLFDNVFYKKKDHEILDEFTNACYWIILLTKNVIKWVLAGYTLNEYSLIYILPILPVLKFFTLGLMNILTFRKRFRGCGLVVVLTMLIIIESIYELPMNYLCPENRIYMHTNYYHIYDTGRRKYFQIICELCENFIVLVFISISIANEKLGIITILALSFCLAVFVYYLMALVYFLFIFKGISGEKEQERRMYHNREYVKASVSQEVVSSMKNYPHIVKSYNDEMSEGHMETKKYMNTSSSIYLIFLYNNIFYIK
jgi:hypothetical protein